MAKRKAGPEREDRLHSIGDITGSKPAERALQGSEEQWRSLVENIPDIIMAVDRDGAILFINRTPPGFTVENTIGAIVYDHVPPEHHDTLRSSLQRVFETGDGHDYEIAAPGPFGRTSWYFNRIGPIVEDGRVVAAAVIATDITERKRVEEALRHGEERYRDLVENISEAIYELDASGRVTYISPVVEEVGGYSPSEIVGRPFADFLHPGDLSRAAEGLQRGLSGHPRPSEYRLLSKTGEVRWARSLGRPIFDGGRVVGVRGVLTDITERKLAEEALRQSEARHRTLLENLPQKIFLKDSSSRYVSCNENFACDLHIEPCEIAGKTDYDFFPKELAEKYRADDRRIMDSGNIEDIEEEYVQDGQRVYVHTVKTPVRDENGDTVGVLGIFWDITERKRMEEALRASEDRYRTLVEAAPDVIYTLSRDGTITSLNSAFESASGWSRDEWRGKHFASIIHPDDLPAAAEDFRLVLRGEVPPVGEYRMLTKSGQYLTAETMPRPLVVDGKIIGSFGIARDITERKGMEEALQKVREDVESRVEREMERATSYGLTFRELTVLHLMADGRSDKEIGIVLGISPLTVQKHVENLRAKMGASSRTEASVRAVREGLVD